VKESSCSSPSASRFWRGGCAIVVLALLGSLIGGCYVSFHPHVREFHAPTYEVFAETDGMHDSGVPRSAKNINFVYSSVAMGGRAHICRFEAPLEDLKAYALADFKRYDRDSNGRTAAFTKISVPAFRPNLDGYGIRDLHWFDVENIQEGITLPRDHDHRPFIWIDTRRNVLYLFWTD
jgi:hypothetical protein